MTRDQVAALAQIYNGAVSGVVARIVDKYNLENAGSRLSTSLQLSADELAKLNRNEPLSINFVDRCNVPRDQEAMVINDVTLADRKRVDEALCQAAPSARARPRARADDQSHAQGPPRGFAR